MEMTRHGNESILRCIITMELELEIVGQTLNWDRCKSDRKLFRPCGHSLPQSVVVGLHTKRNEDHGAGGRGGRQGEGALRVPRAWSGAEEMRKTRRLGGDGDGDGDG